ncbi:MAG: hypothetical protein PHE61_08490 [Candidatus Omnitrophica bacterium]|nr:hypothetical protein [Candidatus Omnitrophota bacterium]
MVPLNRKATASILAFLIVCGVCQREAFADIIDIIRFDRTVEEKLQSGEPAYDPAKSNGVVSPFTNYVGGLIANLEAGKPFEEAIGVKFPDLKPGQIKVVYIDPVKFAKLKEPEDIRNFLGMRVFYVVEANIEDVFNLLTDYNNRWKINDGVLEAKIVKRDKNLAVVDNLREVSIQFIGTRKKYYRTSNIFSLKNDGTKKIIRTQILDSSKQEKEHNIDGFAYYADSLWYLERVSDTETRVFTTSFTLIRWDYEKAPLVFPFIRQMIRKGLVNGTMNGTCKIARTYILKLTASPFKEKSLKDFESDDRRLLKAAAEAAFQDEQSKAIKIDWNEAFHKNGLL